MKYRVTQYAKDDARIWTGETKAEDIRMVLHMITGSDIDADVVKVVVEEVGE